jgi:O-antigen/teichoic acid export membrane protein
LSDKLKERSFGANSALSAISWLVPAVTALFAVPITLHGLGDNAYGLLTLVTALIGYLGLMDMGLGTAIVRFLSYHRALNEGRPMLGLIRFAICWFGGAGVIGGTLLIVGANWIAADLLHVPVGMRVTAVLVIRITGFGFLTGMLVSVGSAIPQSFLRYDIAAVMEIVFGMAGSAGPAILVLLGFRLVAVVAYSVGTDVTAIICYTWIALHLFKPVDKEAGPPWPSIRRQTLRFAAVQAMTRIHSVVATQTSRLVVGAAISIAAAGYYQVPYLLASRANSMLSYVAQVVFPTASGMYARNDEDGVIELYRRTSRLYFLINGSVAMAMCALAHPLIQFWLKRPSYTREGVPALVIFAMSNSINAATMSASYVNLSAVHPGVNLTFSFANSVITLAAVYPLTVHWGVPGAAFAGLIGAATVPVFFWYTHRKIIHVSSLRVWRECYQPTVIGSVAVGVASYYLVRPFLHSLVAALLAFIVLTGVGMVVSGLLGAVKREDMRVVLNVLPRSLRRRRVNPAAVEASTAAPDEDAIQDNPDGPV